MQWEEVPSGLSLSNGECCAAGELVHVVVTMDSSVGWGPMPGNRCTGARNFQQLRCENTHCVIWPGRTLRISNKHLSKVRSTCKCAEARKNALSVVIHVKDGVGSSSVVSTETEYSNQPLKAGTVCAESLHGL